MALQELVLIAARLPKLSSSSEGVIAIEDPHQALLSPLPTSPRSLSEEVILLVLNYQYHLLTCLIRRPAKSQSKILDNLSSVLVINQEAGHAVNWRCQLSKNSDPANIKKADQLLLSTYSILLKWTAIIDTPEATFDQIQLFLVRIYACSCFISTDLFRSSQNSSENDSEKISSFWQQLRKICLIYLRKCPENASLSLATEALRSLLAPVAELSSDQVGFNGLIDVLLIEGKKVCHFLYAFMIRLTWQSGRPPVTV